MGKTYHKDSHSFEDGSRKRTADTNGKKSLNNYVDQYYDYEEGISDEFELYDDIDIQHKKQR